MEARTVVSEDVLLYGDDGKLYHLKPHELEHYEVDSGQPEYSTVMEMLDHGVVAAATRQSTQEVTMPVLCYLLNLGALRLKDVPASE